MKLSTLADKQFKFMINGQTLLTITHLKLFARYLQHTIVIQIQYILQKGEDKLLIKLNIRHCDLEL